VNHCRRRRPWCPEHGARTEGVPPARPRSEFARDFECLVAWLATRTDKTTITQTLRIDWDTVGRIIKRVCDDELDPDRPRDLFEIGIDEVSSKKQHNYLTLVADHRPRQVAQRKGQAAADEFFDELDPKPARRSLPAAPAAQPAVSGARARDHGSVRPCPTVLAGHGIPAAWPAAARVPTLADWADLR
jgi:transposase